MITNNKFFLCIFGTDRMDIITKLKDCLDNKVVITDTQMCTYFVNNIYSTGLPDKPIIVDHVELLLHGIVFPYNVTFDEFSDYPDLYLKRMIYKYKNDLFRLPYAFKNGSYCGVTYDATNDIFYAFTCFLNSIPLYYTQIRSSLIVSNDFCLIAQLLDLKLKVSDGLIEYYVLGTNLSDNTAFDEIKTIPKGGYLSLKDGSISIDYYYTMPDEKPARKFDDYVDEFANIWEENVNALHSDKFVYGLGLTGGVDSRLIFSAFKNKSKPILFTGPHPEHPDYLIAKKMTSSLGLNNHYLEDYRYVDRLTGYAEFCSMADNPLLANTIYIHNQLLFRKTLRIIYELNGGINLYGGEHYYYDRRSLYDTIIRSLTIPNTKIVDNSDFIKEIINLLVRNIAKYDDLLYIPAKFREIFWYNLEKTYYILFKQIGNPVNRQSLLERLRHIHKSTNLLSWNSLGGRRYNEKLMPEMNIELTNFACRIPLKYRDTRRILLAYLKRYHPETAKFILSGYIFSADSPWIIYKLLSNYIKVINALGYKIPILQWYIKPYTFPSLETFPEVKKFQKKICSYANIINDSIFNSLFLQFPNDSVRLMRLFNIAILQMRLEMGEDNLKSFLIEQMNIIKV